jgi:isopentenyl-diphosphate delta-isomerase
MNNTLEKVILVNENDEPIGSMEKLEAHQKGLLHRAFSIFLFNNDGHLLLQQRASGKYHSPSLWTNTCCSHQREGESNIEAGNRRLGEEMGIETKLNEAFSFTYKADMKNGLTEHEYDHVLFGTVNDDPKPNPKEVQAWAYIPMNVIEQDIETNPERYTAWFKIVFNQVKEHLYKQKAA